MPSPDCFGTKRLESGSGGWTSGISPTPDGSHSSRKVKRMVGFDALRFVK